MLEEGEMADERMVETVLEYFRQNMAIARIVLKLVSQKSTFSFEVPFEIMVRLLERGVAHDLVGDVPKMFDEYWDRFDQETGTLVDEFQELARNMFWLGYALGLRRASREDLATEHSFAENASGVLEAEDILRKAEPPESPDC